MEKQYSTWNQNRFPDCAICNIGTVDMIYLSGIGPEHAETGEIQFRGDPEAQARYAYARIKAVLEKNGSGLHEIVRIVAYLTDMRDKESYERVKKEYFADLELPVHTTLEVSKLAWPGMDVEVEVTAIHPH